MFLSFFKESEPLSKCLLDIFYSTFDNYLHHWVDTTAGGRFVPDGMTSPVVNTSVLT